MRESLRKTCLAISHYVKAEFLHFVYSSLRESATTFAVETLRLVKGLTCFVEEEFGNRSFFESQRVRVQANMADLNSVWLKVKKNDAARDLLSQVVVEAVVAAVAVVAGFSRGAAAT